MFSNLLTDRKGYQLIESFSGIDFYAAYGISCSQAGETLKNHLHLRQVRTILVTILQNHIDDDFIHYLTPQSEFFYLQTVNYNAHIQQLIQNNHQKVTRLLSSYLDYHANCLATEKSAVSIIILNALGMINGIELRVWQIDSITAALKPYSQMNQGAYQQNTQLPVGKTRKDLAYNLSNNNVYSVVIFGYDHAVIPSEGIPKILLSADQPLIPITAIKPVLTQHNRVTDHPQPTHDESINMNVLDNHYDAPIKQYLHDLIKQHDGLTVLTQPQHKQNLPIASFRLPIDKLYVALTVDTTAHSERDMYFVQLNQHLQLLWHHNQLFPFTIHHKLVLHCQHLARQKLISLENIQWDTLLLSEDVLTPNEQTIAFSCLDEAVHSFDLTKRHQQNCVAASKKQQLTLAQAYDAYTHLVILGDPGSGKSTLARWLIVNMAKAFLANDSRLSVPEYQVDPKSEHKTDKTISIGEQVRIPIFMSVAEYARYCEDSSREKSINGFIHYKYPATAEALFHCLRNDRVLIILDGFDEIAQRENRQAITQHIHCFLDQWHTNKIFLSSEKRAKYSHDYGNRFFITSRIAGNYTSALQTEFTRITIEPLDQQMVRLFFRRWFDAIKQTIPTVNEVEKHASKLFRLVVNDRHLSELIKTPQMATIIAYVYVSQNYVLPKSKIALYQAAIDQFSQVWKSRLNSTIHHDNYFNDGFIILLLQHVAYQAHRHSGPISELVLREAFYTTVTHYYPALPETEVANYVKALLTIITEDVGLIIPYGINNYQFIHRQFQEYLASRYILAKDTRNASSAYELILELLADMNWHEPIRLALDCLGQEDPAQWLLLMHKMQEVTTNQSLSMPLITYMTTDVLIYGEYTKLQTVCSDNMRYGQQFNDLLKKIIVSLSSAYAIQWSNDCHGIIQHTQTSFAQLVTSNFKQQVINVCVEIFSTSQFAIALARLLLDCEFKHAALALPLHDLLKKTLSLEYNGALIQLLNQHDSFADQSKSEQSASQPLTNNIATVLHSPWIKSPIRFGLLTVLFPMRQHLQVLETRKDYHYKANFLILPEYFSNSMKSLLQYKWGSDALYRIAVFLDTSGEKKKKTWSQEIDYQPGTGFLEDKCISLLEDAAIRYLSISQLTGSITNYYQQASLSLQKITSLLMLIALGEEITNYYAVLTGEEKEKLRSYLSFLYVHYQDIVYRIVNNNQQKLRQLHAVIPSAQFNLVWDAFIYHFVTLTENVFIFKRNFILITNLDITSNLSHFAHVFSACLLNKDKYDQGSKDYSCPFITELVKRITLAQSTQLFDYLAFVILPSLTGLYWPIDHLPTHTPTFLQEKAVETTISWQTLTLMAQLPEKAKWVFELLFNQIFTSAVQLQPALLPELLIIVRVLYQGDLSTQHDYLRGICPDFPVYGNWLKDITSRIAQINPPYYRARAWLRLAISQGNRQKEFLQCAHGLIPLIQALEQRIEITALITEYAGLVLPKDEAIAEQEKLTDEVLLAVSESSNYGQNALVYARLSLLNSGVTAVALIQRSIHALELLNNEEQRAYYARLLRPIWQLQFDPNVQEAISQFYQNITNPLYREFAMRGVGRAVKLLVENCTNAYKTWSFFHVTAQIHDTLAQLSVPMTQPQLWQTFSQEPTEELAKKLLQQSNGNGFEFDLTVALVMDYLQQHDQIPIEIFKLLLPHFKRATGDTQPILIRWLLSTENTEKHQLLLHTALLLLTEMHNKIHANYADETLALLEHPFDEWRHRMGYFLYEEPIRHFPPNRSTSVLGKKVCLAIANFSVDTQHSVKTIKWICHFLLHDDVLFVENLIQQLNNSEDINQIKRNAVALRIADYALPDIVTTLINHLVHGNSATRDAIVMTLFQLNSTNSFIVDNRLKIKNDHLQNFLEQLQSMDLSTICKNKFEKNTFQERTASLVNLITNMINQTAIDYEIIRKQWLEENSIDLSQLVSVTKTIAYAGRRTSEFSTEIKKLYDSNYIVSLSLKNELGILENAAKEGVKKGISIEHWLNLLVQAIQQSLASSFRNDDTLLSILLGINMQLALAYPWQFRQVAHELIQFFHPDLAKDLLRCFKKSSWLDRIFYFPILTNMPISQEMFEVIFLGLLGGGYGLDTAFSALQQLSIMHTIDNELVDYFCQVLSSDSVLICSCALEILIKIATSELTRKELRQKITAILNQQQLMINAQRFIVTANFPQPIAGIPNLFSCMLKGMVQIAQFPDYSYEHKKRLQSLKNDVNIASIKHGDVEALLSYIQQNTQLSWSDTVIKHALDYDEKTNSTVMFLRLIHHEKFQPRSIETLAPIVKLLHERKQFYLIDHLRQCFPEVYTAYDTDIGFLIEAVKTKNYDYCAFLLNNDANINQKNKQGTTPIQQLFTDYPKYYDDRLCQLLLAHSPEIYLSEIPDANNLSLIKAYMQSLHAISPKKFFLTSAICAGYVDVARELLKQGLSVETKNAVNQTLLQLAITKKQTKIIELLLEHGANTSVQDEQGKTPLITIINFKLYAIYDEMIQRSRLMLNHHDHSGDTALHFAALNGDLQLCESLIDCGADPNQIGIRNALPLHNACWNTKISVAYLLMKHTHNINAQADEGATCLHLAIIDGNALTIVNALIERGASANDHLCGISVGTLVVIRGISKQIDYFRARGITASATDLANISPCYYILNDPACHTLVSGLDDLGLDLSIPGANGETWLIHAVKNKLDSAITILLNLFVDPNMPNSKGETAFEVAKQTYTEGHTIIHLIQEKIAQRKVCTTVTKSSNVTSLRALHDLSIYNQQSDITRANSVNRHFATFK